MPKATQKITPPKKASETPEKPTNPRISRAIMLAFGDVVAFLAFAAIGRGTHNEPTGLAAVPEIILTAAPFALGWFIVAPLVGAFRPDIIKDPGAMAKRTVLAWTLSWPVALALRWFSVEASLVLRARRITLGEHRRNGFKLRRNGCARVGGPRSL